MTSINKPHKNKKNNKKLNKNKFEIVNSANVYSNSCCINQGSYFHHIHKPQTCNMSL